MPAVFALAPPPAAIRVTSGPLWLIGLLFLVTLGVGVYKWWRDKDR